MKKNFLFSGKSQRLAVAVATILFTSVVVTSCSDDDESESLPSIPELKGDYLGEAEGDMIYIDSHGDSTSYQIIPKGDETAVISVNADNTISVKEPTFYTASPADADDLYSYPGAIIQNIELTEGVGSYTFNVGEYSSMNGLYTVAGTIRGEFKGKKLILDYTFLHAGGMVGTVHFEGVRK